MDFFDNNGSENDSSSSSNSRSKKEHIQNRLQQLTQKNGYEINQSNGQRIYLPPTALKIRPPPKGCEVFIGKLYKNIYEDELIPLFEKIAPLYMFRLMLDFTDRTRGYAFATYFKPEHAIKAIARLNDYEIRPNLRIGVYKSVDNCRLFVGNVPTDKKREDFLEMFRQYVEGIKDVIVYVHLDNPEMNRGFVFVEFESHRLAAMARRQFTPENLVVWDRPLYIDWADPLPDVHPKIMAKVTIIYVCNLPVSYTTDELHTVVSNLVGREIIKKTHKMYNYAFIHFKNRHSAEFAMTKLTGLKLEDQIIQVEWARPRKYSKKNRLATTPTNFCTSVPPSMRRLVRKHLSEVSPNSIPNCNLFFEDSKIQMFNVEDVFSNCCSHIDFRKYSCKSPNLTNRVSEYNYFCGPSLSLL